jgi:hypothetical protein
MKRRRYQREKRTAAATHIIKTGVSGERFPRRLNGFLICRNTLDANSKKQIDYGAMEALGYSKADVEKGIELGVKAEPGKYLPSSLHFILPSNVSRDESGDWNFKGVYNETLFSMFEKGGDGKYIQRDLPFCISEDGVTASRLDERSNTRHKIACNPMGCDVPPEQWCEVSACGDCKPKVKVFLSLYREEGEKVEPLDPSLGYSATYMFETSSDMFGTAVQDALTSAADILDGRIGHILGVLTVGKRNTLKNGKTVVAPVYTLTLDQGCIQQRYNELSGRTLIAASAPVAMLTNDYDDPEHVEEIELDEEPEQQQAQPAQEWHEDVKLDDIKAALMCLALSIQQAHEGMPNEEAIKEATYLGVEKDGKTIPVSQTSFDYFADMDKKPQKQKYLRALHEYHTKRGTEGYALPVGVTK